MHTETYLNLIKIFKPVSHENTHPKINIKKWFKSVTDKGHRGDPRSYTTTKLKGRVGANMTHVPECSRAMVSAFRFMGPTDASFVVAFHFFHQFIFCIVARRNHLQITPPRHRYHGKIEVKKNA